MKSVDALLGEILEQRTAVTEPHESSQEPEDYDLTPKQAQAVDLIAVGMDDTSVALAVNVRRETVNRWRHSHPWVQAAVNARRKDAWSRSRERLRQVVCGAVDVLAASIEAAQARVRQGEAPTTDDVKAATQVLRMVRAGEWSLEPYGQTSGNEIASRWVERKVQAEMEAELGDDEDAELDEELLWERCEKRYQAEMLHLSAQDGTDEAETFSE